MDNFRFYTAVSLDSVFLPTLLRSSLPEGFSISSTNATRPLQRSDAYFFAIAAFVCQIIKSQSDLQHLYFSRRASVRVKGELVASVYEKALKRKDVTGAVQKDQEKDAKGKGKGKDKAGKPDAPQDSSSADVGKIVSLIAADADRVSRFVSLGPVSSWHYDILGLQTEMLLNSSFMMLLSVLLSLAQCSIISWGGLPLLDTSLCLSRFPLTPLLCVVLLPSNAPCRRCATAACVL